MFEYMAILHTAATMVTHYNHLARPQDMLWYKLTIIDALSSNLMIRFVWEIPIYFDHE